MQKKRSQSTKATKKRKSKLTPSKLKAVKAPSEVKPSKSRQSKVKRSAAPPKAKTPSKYKTSSELQTSELKPSESKPSGVKTSEVKTSQRKPSEAKSSQVNTSGRKQSEAKSSGAKPSEAKTSEVKTSKRKPSGAKPSEIKSLQAKPPSESKKLQPNKEDAKLKSSKLPQQQQPQLRRKKSSASKNRKPFSSGNEKFKPFFSDNRVPSFEETSAIRGTLETLRALFGSETLPYYEEFSGEPHRPCYALILTAFCCISKISMYALIIAITVIFQTQTLNYLQDAFDSVFRDSDAPAIPGSIIQTFQSLCIGIYTFCSLAILVDVSLIAASVLKHIRGLSISIAAGFFINFWAIFFMFSVAVAGFNQKELTSSFLGNLGIRDFQLSPTGHAIHKIQEEFHCCGFEGAKDWHKISMFRWEEPGIEEDRILPYPLHWLEKCASSYVCFSPNSCCKKEFLKTSNSTCNQANMTKDAFNALVDQDFNLLSKTIQPKYINQLYNEGCVDIIGERLKDWALYALAVSIIALVLWMIIIVFLTILLAEISGLGSVNPKTGMVDPSTLKDIPTCCEGGSAWLDDAIESEIDAIRSDHRALTAIEEGKPLADIDLTASTSNISIFIPSKKELRRLADPSGVESDKKQKSTKQLMNKSKRK